MLRGSGIQGYSKRETGLFIAAVISSAAVLLLCLHAPCLVGAVESDPVALEVGGEQIPLSDIQSEFNSIIKSKRILHSFIGESSYPKYWEQARESVIRRKLFQQEARRLGIVADVKEIDEYVAVKKANWGSEEKFTRALELQGKTLETYRELAGYDIIISKFKDRFRNEIVIDGKEVEKYYSDNQNRFHRREGLKLRQIFRRYPSKEAGSPEEVMNELDRLKGRILAGEDFGNLAREYSEDEQNKAKGGELGFLYSDELSDEFKTVAADLEEGEISPVFSAKSGYYIIQLVERVPEKKLSLKEAGPQIIKALKERKVISNLVEMEKNLRKSVKIVDHGFKGQWNTLPE